MVRGDFFKLFSFFLFISSCDYPSTDENRFTEVSRESGAIFNNALEYTETFNPYTYRNFYNGGGVALGDVNNDGWLDIYFTGNVVDNKLYLNKGNWKFVDITEAAGVACPNVWSSGASFADVNGDGYLDLYVCKSGKPEGSNRHNELFINNGNLTFRDVSKEFGLDVTGLSTHAAFFDFDLDGDLDCYVLTNSIRSVGVGYDLIKDQRSEPDPNGGGNKLFRNDGGHFRDVTQEMGIYTSAIGFGLGITISDFNKDNYPDIFISNDFFERDYLYINNQGRHFSEKVEEYFQSISMGSMGADVADLDNDLLPDLMVTEMLPASLNRKKTKTIFESWDKYALAVSKGYFHQYPRNVLQKNLGENFVDLSRQAGVAATEWSWGSLIFDMNNDGSKDIFVANGIYKDLLDRDYLTHMANDAQVRQILHKKDSAIKDLIDIMPSSPVSNFAYKNLGNFEFEDVSQDWNLDQPGFSNGSAYGDLDNDGDLDLVVNNVNMQSFVYRNNTDTSLYKSLKISLAGAGGNTAAIGAKVTAYVGTRRYVVENYPSRGFESSVDPVLHFGLGSATEVDSLEVVWPGGHQQMVYSVPTNHHLKISETAAPKGKANVYTRRGDVLKKVELLVSYHHQENEFVDFDRDRLLPMMYHNEGPAISVGDINGDGLEDLFMGGAKGFTGKIILQNSEGFGEGNNDFLSKNSISEDVDNLFFDCDGDGDLDLYVASGSREFSASSSALLDRLYINDGKGNFVWEKSKLPFTSYFSTSVVINEDIDGDGDQDLFVGERFHPFHYGRKVKGYLLINDGMGNFTDKTDELCLDLVEVDMITDAVWADYNNDGKKDLLISSDWGPIRIFENQQGKFIDKTEAVGLATITGWWNTLVTQDVDDDGDLDIVAGNHGRNSFFKDATRMYIHDFDKNGSQDYIICHLIDGKYYPVVDRNELVAQLPELKKKILYFKDYAKMNIEDLFASEELEAARVLEASHLASSVFYNEDGRFTVKALPPTLQYSPIYTIYPEDINDDGRVDLLFGGNQYLVKPQFGRYDAMPLTILYGSSDGVNDENVLLTSIFGQIRDIKALKLLGKKLIIVGFNDAPVEAYEVKK